MKRYNPVGICIYCGSREDLRDEHIIPFALNGDWILPKASCRACEAITSSFEQKVLRGPLWLPRVALGLKTRRPKSQPSTFPIETVKGSDRRLKRVTIDKHLPSVILPMYGPANFLISDEIQQGIKVEGMYIGHTLKTPEQAMQELGVDGIALEVEYPVVEFARMIAKIAYGYAVGELGLDNVKNPLVLPAIKGMSNDIGHWVGSIPEAKAPPTNNALHIAKIERNGDFIAVALSLFALQPTVIYLVLVSKGAGPVVS